MRITLFLYTSVIVILQSVIANKTVQGFQYSFDKYPPCGQSVVVSHLPRVGSMSPHFILLLAMFLIFFLPFLWKNDKTFSN